MDRYRKPYIILWNHLTDAIEMIENKKYEEAKNLMIKAHQDAEEIIMDLEDILL